MTPNHLISAIPVVACRTMNRLLVFLSALFFLLAHLTSSATTPDRDTVPSDDGIPEPMQAISAPVDMQNELFGYNAEYMIDQCLETGGEINLLNPLTVVRLDQACLQLVEEINPAVLRFPGGTTANYYHYYGTGYGYDAAEIFGTSIGLGELALDDIMPSNFIELFADLALQTESRVIYTMNLFTHFKPGGASINNPQSAAYLERKAENMDALAYLVGRGVDVVAVELGNELYFEWELTGIFTINTAVDKYVDLARDYANTIRSNYPDIEIGVPGALVNSNPEFNFWNEKMQEAEFADGIVVHEYDRNIADNCDGGLDKASYFACARDQIDHFLDFDYEDQLKDYMDLFPDKDLWLTEWGIGDPYRVANTFIDAYSVFGMLNKFSEFVMDHPGRISFANRHNLITAGYYYPAFGTKFLNESDELFYLDNKAIRASAYPAKLMTGILTGGYQYAGKAVISNCRIWVYTNDSGYKLAVSNNSGTEQQLTVQELAVLLEETGLEFEAWSSLSADKLYSAAGISHDNQSFTNLTNEFVFTERALPDDPSIAFIPGNSISVLQFARGEEPSPPEPGPVPEIYFNINPTICFGQLNVKVSSDVPTGAELTIVNSVTGGVALQQDVTLQAGFNAFYYNMDMLPAASFSIYRIVITFPGGIRERSFFYVG